MQVYQRDPDMNTRVTATSVCNIVEMLAYVCKLLEHAALIPLVSSWDANFIVVI